MIVVDASVVGAALLDASGVGDWSESILRRDRMGAPHLLHAEVASIIRKSERAGLLSSDGAALAHDELLTAPVTLFGYSPFADRIFELRHNLTTYDAWYVALAELTRSPLATLDGRLAAAPGLRCDLLTPDVQ